MGLSTRRLDGTLWEVDAPGRSDMRVPARIYASEKLLAEIRGDLSLEQLCNVATLPGVVDFALAMPDIHQGYGFPVGGIAATDPAQGGVVSPGGVGYDINCGVRLLASDLSAAELGGKREELVHELSRRIPSGLRGAGTLRVSAAQLDDILLGGGPALRGAAGLGTPADIDATESGGVIADADSACVSPRAKERGRGQLGTIGSGNHFLELEEVTEIFDSEAARAFELRPGQLCVLIHTGSRGLGHQVCGDHVKIHDARLEHWGIALPDRQLACAPIESPEGDRYLKAMRAAANFAFANRQAIAHEVREGFARVLGRSVARGVTQVYDVAHNIAKFERYGGRDLCVHRKGATRAFGPSSPELPEAYRGVGQPVFIPGSMGTESFVLAGCDAAAERSFATVCHGAGRRLSRTQSRKRIGGRELRKQLAERGIVVRSPSNRGLAEEAPFAYKAVEEVVDVVHGAGLARRVARMRPLGVVKG